jgi:hypothetical protein
VTADALRPEDAVAAAWCASTDVASGVTSDDPRAAVEGWCSAARRAAAATGRPETDDALLRAVARAGVAAVADAYARERRSILAQISARRGDGA